MPEATRNRRKRENMPNIPGVTVPVDHCPPCICYLYSVPVFGDGSMMVKAP